MLSVEQARARILADLIPTTSEIVSLARAADRVTASAVVAHLDRPAHDVSAMDGYAARADTATPGATLTVVGAAPAGRPFAGRVAPGQALRVFTGSVIPDGADAVILQENVAREGDVIILDQPVEAGQHIRRRGGDYAAGDVLLQAGVRLGAAAIGLAASADRPWLTVRRRPTIALLATGDEISLPGEPMPAGGLPSSNSFALAALVEAAGGTPLILPIAADDLDAIAGAAASASHADMLVTLGGASVGDHDLVRPALARHGFEPDVWRIAMRPGKPLMHGHLRFGSRAVPVLGLPGNPVSALICAALFLRPAIARLLGLPAELPRLRRMRLAAPLPTNDARADHLRATISLDENGQEVVTSFLTQDSARLRDLTRADALILRLPHAQPVPAGEMVDTIRLTDLFL